MKKLMVVGFAAMGAAMAFGNVNDDAAFIHYGLEFKANGDALGWPDVRHYSTWNPSSVTGTHRTTGDRGSQGLTEGVFVDVTTPTLGRTLKNEPVVRLNHKVTEFATSNLYDCACLAIRGCKADEKVYTALLRFRPKMGLDWVRNSSGDTERLLCLSPQWSPDAAAARGIYVEIANRTQDGSCGYMRIENGVSGVATVFTNLKVTNGYWHELAVIVENNTITLGLCCELFTDAPNRWRWESKTFAENIQFALKGTEAGSLSRGSGKEKIPTSPRGDFHYLAMWYRALSKDEVYEAFSGGRGASALSFGLDTAEARAEAYCGGSGDATVALRPWGWSAMPASLAKGQKVSFMFDVTANRDRLLQTLSVLPTDDSGAGTVDVSLDGKAVGSLELAGGRPGELTLAADRIPVGSHTVTLERTDSTAATLALKGLSLGQVARKGNVFNDALFLKYGVTTNATTGRVTGWPDHRHYSTWNPAVPSGVHATDESNKDVSPVGSIAPATYDVYSPTAGRTFAGEPCVRMSEVIVTNAETGAITYHQPQLTVNGLTTGQKIWSLLVRFRPDWEGWMANNSTGEWERFFCLGPKWDGNPELSRGLYIGIKPNAAGANGPDSSGHLYFNNGNTCNDLVKSGDWPEMTVSNQVWHEMAVLVSNNVLKIGLCNAARNAGDAKCARGQWLWRTVTNGAKVQYAFGSSSGSFGRGMQNQENSSSFRGDVHMFAMWNRVLDESEVCEAFASGRTPLLDVGFDEDGATQDVFLGDETRDVTLASTRPWDWHNLPYALKAGRKISIPFTKESWHDGLPQVLRVYPDSASAAGTQVKVSIDGKAIADLALVPGQTDASTYLRASDIALGDHTLTIARTDSGSGDLVLAGVSIEGSWRVDTVAGFSQIGAYATSNSPILPYWYDAVCSWPSASGFTRNDWNSGVGPSRFRFEIPEDMLEMGYRYRLQYKIGTAFANGVKGYPVMFILNGVTNYLSHTEDNSTMRTPQSFDLNPELLRPGNNVVEFFDNRQVPDETQDKNGYIRNSWTSLEYIRVLVKQPKTGFMFLLR